MMVVNNKVKNRLPDYNRVYEFGEAKSGDVPSGNAIAAQRYRIFRSSRGMFQGAGDDDANTAIIFPGYEKKVTLIYEILHLFGLNHSFKDIHTTVDDYTYTESGTDNLMDYIHPELEDDYRWSLWYWQIKRLWNELK